MFRPRKKQGEEMADHKPERRQYTRINKNFLLNYYEINNPVKQYAASQLKNISVGGICLISPQSFSPGTMLGFKIKTPFLIEMASLEGEVLQTHERIKGIIYEVRIKFRKMSPEASKALASLVDHFTKSETEL
jgi:hypothetical protein